MIYGRHLMTKLTQYSERVLVAKQAESLKLQTISQPEAIWWTRWSNECPRVQTRVHAQQGNPRPTKKPSAQDDGLCSNHIAHSPRAETMPQRQLLSAHLKTLSSDSGGREEQEPSGVQNRLQRTFVQNSCIYHYPLFVGAAWRRSSWRAKIFRCLDALMQLAKQPWRYSYWTYTANLQATSYLRTILQWLTAVY